MFDVWILTFERPKALTRLIGELNKQRRNVAPNYPSILSNSPQFGFEYPEGYELDLRSHLLINTLNDRNSNSWCARSWNTVFAKGFQTSDALVCIQDDTMIGPNFVKWLEEQSQKYDFISGPAGDQFFYIHKRVFQKIGWWDERFIGCYCGDADYFKRVALEYDSSKVSIEDSHNWGWRQNPCGLWENVITTYESKTVDPDYDNQHWALERMCTDNPTLKHSQGWYKRKWGVDLDINAPAVYNGTIKLESDINWYPSHSKLLGVTAYD